MTESPTSPRIQFSLRLLIIAALVLSVLLGWIAIQLHWIEQRNKALRWIRPLEERQAAASTGAPLPPVKGSYVQRSDFRAPWTIAVFGEAGVERIELDPTYNPAEEKYSIDYLRRLFPEAEVVRSEHDGGS